MRPVLAYAAIDAAREMISPDRDGILFEDASALADGLRRIIDHEDFATALGRSGFAQAVDRYSSHAVGRAVITSLWPNIGPAGKGGARSKQKRKSGTSTKSRQPTSSSVTKAAIASEAVRPGDSIPKRLTRPGSP
jgi:hypothetical protein